MLNKYFAIFPLHLHLSEESVLLICLASSLPWSFYFSQSEIPSECIYQEETPDFSGGAVVKNLPANAGDTGSSPGPGRSHMPRSN